MELYHKPFNRLAYNSSDPKSREVMQRYFKSLGYIFTDNQDKFGIDIISHQIHMAIELEQRTIWKRKEYPYTTYHLPARKRHHFTQPLSGFKSWFCVINATFDYAMMVSGERILKYVSDEESLATITCQHAFQDSFYDIPISEFKMFYLN